MKVILEYQNDKAARHLREAKKNTHKARVREPGEAEPNRTNLMTQPIYRTPDDHTPVRAGSQDFLRLPSIHGTQAVYRDRGHL